MKAIICRSYGAPDDVLQLVDVDKPEMAEDEVLVPNGALAQISDDSNNRWIGPLDRIIATALLSPLVSQRMTSFTVQSNRVDLALLADLFETGTVAPVIDRTYPLHEVPEPIRHVEQGPTRGKVVVTVTAPRATQEPTLRASAADDATHRS